MNAPLPWRDPVVAEIHAIREELDREYGGDLLAYSNAAVAHCSRLNLHPVSMVGVKVADAKAQATLSEQSVKSAAH